MNVGSYIKKLRIEAGLSQEELGKIVGVQKSAVHKWESGLVTNLKRETIKKLSEIFSVPAASFIDSDDLNLRPLNEELSVGTKIPVLGKVPAGIPIEAIEDIIDEVELSAKMSADGKDYFALLVSGNSMYPEYMDGDIVIVRKQETAETGDDVVAYVNGYDATLKRLVRSMRGITLRPLNPEFEARTYTNQEIQTIPIRIAGVVVEQRRNRK